MTSSKFLSAFAALSILAAPVAVAGSLDIHTKPVSLAGLDLNSEAGADLALDRIEDAAKKVCDLNKRRMQPMWQDDVATCMKGAIEGAIASIDQDKVTARYKERVAKG